MKLLRDPEALWDGAAAPPRVDRREVEARLGPTDEPLEPLSGGRANLNIRVGRDRVLRVYRRDLDALQKERCLLCRGWSSLRVPRVLEVGSDFLLLEHVPHVPLPAGREQGAAAGRALAEVHDTGYDRAGFLDGSAEVVEPLEDFFGAVVAHLATELDGPARGIADLGPAVLRCLEARGAELAGPDSTARLLHGDFKASNLKWVEETEELLVLDWEFAYAGPALMDVGQLLRWGPPRRFVEAFETAYREGGGHLPADWQRSAAALDLANLVSLFSGAPPDSRRATDLRARMELTLAALADSRRCP